MIAVDNAAALMRHFSVVLAELASSIDESFERAIFKIRECPGKVVVTGMGKAGLVGQKISATLRSTGTPSVFLDPAQALHGDMGMIAQGDCVLALSNSGETDEVLAVVSYARKRPCRVVSITGNHKSPIALAADTSLSYPKQEEGCPIGRAPMASTLQMLAIGDALAAELMARRGFSEQDFLALHHGGYLGREIRRAANG